MLTFFEKHKLQSSVHVTLFFFVASIIISAPFHARNFLHFLYLFSHFISKTFLFLYSLLLINTDKNNPISGMGKWILRGNLNFIVWFFLSCNTCFYIYRGIYINDLRGFFFFNFFWWHQFFIISHQKNVHFTYFLARLQSFHVYIIP